MVRNACFILFLVAQIAMVARAQEPKLRDQIDRHIRQGWDQAKVKPAQAASDAVFHRRVHLDLVGSIPTYQETKAFLADASPEKRTKLIDRLLADSRFSEHQAKVWELVLFGRNNANNEVGKRTGIRTWLEGKFAKNVPYDQWVKDLIIADGNSMDQGPPLFYVQFRAQPEETTVGVTRIFLGTQLQCAQCHDHPYDKWTQLDFYGMAAFFARVVLIDGGGTTGAKKFTLAEKRTGEVLFTGPAVQAKPGQKGEPVGAKFLGGSKLVEPELPKGFQEVTKGAKSLPKPDFSRKEQLANWLVSPDNAYFARAAVNRVWGQFLRRGIVHPVDNLSESNKASHAELLDLLAVEFKKKQFDLKWLIREIVSSHTYQLASVGPTGEPLQFEQMPLRPLSAEEMIRGLKIATGYGESDKLPPNFDESAVRQFGAATDGRGEYQASLTERLFVNNSGLFRSMIHRRPGGLWDAIAKSKSTMDENVDRLFLSVLNRPPSAEERRQFGEHLAQAKGSSMDTVVEEAIWALLASAEFRFNH